MSSTALKGGYDNSRYKILDKDGNHVNASVNWFSLRLDGKDNHALVAIDAYADSVQYVNPQLATDLRALLTAE